MAYTTPTTAAAYDTLTATIWNASVRDNFQALADARTDTGNPAITGSGSNPTVGYTLQEWMQVELNKFIVVQLNIVISSFSGGSGDLIISIPDDARAPGSGLVHIGQGFMYDVSATTRYFVTAERTAASSIKLGRDGTSGYATVSAPFAPANGDGIYLSLLYEAA